jgi:hypothetical protein
MTEGFAEGSIGVHSHHVRDCPVCQGYAADNGARRRAVERLIRIHAPEYRRLLAQERARDQEQQS